jgi:Tetratricopeptide repeat
MNQAARAGSAHQEITTLLYNLVVLHRQRGRLPTAQACYEQALTILKPTLGPKHPSTRTCRDNLERMGVVKDRELGGPHGSRSIHWPQAFPPQVVQQQSADLLRQPLAGQGWA